MPRFSIQTTIRHVSEAMQAGVVLGIIRLALRDEGFSKERINTIIRWAKQANKMNKKVYHLHRWSVQFYDVDPYLAPEAQRRCLLGYRDDDTKRVSTSPIVSVNGREVQTCNSIYILEEIDPNYLKWLEESHVEYDPEHPIKIKKG